MTARILVVEDEHDLAELVSIHLKGAGHHVVTCYDGTSALSEVQARRPDLVVLDVMLPGISGLEVCRRLRRQAETVALPVIMLTAKTDELDRIVGFEVGADDYVMKPFSPRELVLRVDAILRRTRPSPTADGPQQMSIGNIQIDIPGHRVEVDGEPVLLTALEFRLLVDLVSRAGRVQTREALLERVWGYAPDVETRTVDTHIKRLREKLGAGSAHVETVRGVGYRALS